MRSTRRRWTRRRKPSTSRRRIFKGMNHVNGHDLAIGVDLGATKIATVLADRSGRVLSARQTPTRASDGPAAVCDRIAGEIRELLSQTSAPVAGVGIGSPGVVDGERGI